MADVIKKIGFHGKMPTMGDFVTRRLPSSLVERWDDWMQSCMAYSKENIGDRWDQTYMVGPVWRFFLQSGVISSNPWCGLMFPSVDRVGRYFPFALLVPLEDGVEAASLLLNQSRWFDEIETLALQILSPSLQFEDWDRLLEAHSLPSLPVITHLGGDTTVPLKPPDLAPHLSVVVPLGKDTEALIDWLLSGPGHPRALWWKRFESDAAVSLRITEDLPDPSSFPGFLCDDLKRWGWAEKTYAAGG